MLKRNEKDKLVLNSLKLEVFIRELFEQCKTEDEVESLKEQIQDIIEDVTDEKINDIYE